MTRSPVRSAKALFSSFSRFLKRRPYPISRVRLYVEQLEDRLSPATFNPAPGTADGAAGSLRADIITANGNGDTTNTFNLAAGTYTLNIANGAGGQENASATGDLDLTKGNATYIFNGNGKDSTFIDQTVVDRVFQAFANVTVQFNDLTIEDGQAIDNGVAGTLPSVTTSLGGGILSQTATLQLTNVNVKNNKATGGSGATGALGAPGGNGQDARGGGIAAAGGTVTLTTSDLSSNAARGGQGGLGGTGTTGTNGAVGGTGGNAAGGGLFADTSMVTLTNSTANLNFVTAGGGGTGGIGGSGALGGGNGGNGGNAGPDGNAAGGAVGLVGGALTTTGSTFQQNLVSVSASGLGGPGGTGGTNLAGAGGNGGTGGQGAIGGSATGGGLSLVGATVNINTAKINLNIASGGSGGIGGIGGTGGTGTTVGGAGGNGGVAGVAGEGSGGGAFLADNTNIAITNTTINQNNVSGGIGGFGGIGGQPGIPGGTAGNGTNGTAGGNGLGGGLMVRSLNAATTVTLTASTIALNLVSGGPGGIGGNGGAIGGNGGNGGAAGGGSVFVDVNTTFTAINSTFSTNIVTGGDGASGGNGANTGGNGGNGGASQGGGIFVSGAANAVATLNNSTVAFSTVNDDKGGAGGSPGGTAGMPFQGQGGGIFIGLLGNATAVSTIFSNDTATVGPEVSGTITAGASLFQNTAGATILQGPDGPNVTGVAAGLGGLADNGGPTQTHAITINSPALDRGANPLNLPADQRGFMPRAVDGLTDIGSFEFGAIPTPPVPPPSPPPSGGGGSSSGGIGVFSAPPQAPPPFAIGFPFGHGLLFQLLGSLNFGFAFFLSPLVALGSLGGSQLLLQPLTNANPNLFVFSSSLNELLIELLGTANTSSTSGSLLLQKILANGGVSNQIAQLGMGISLGG